MGMIIPACPVDAGSKITSAECQARSRHSFVLSLVNNFSIISSERAKLIWHLQQAQLSKKKNKCFFFNISSFSLNSLRIYWLLPVSWPWNFSKSLKGAVPLLLIAHQQWTHQNHQHFSLVRWIRWCHLPPPSWWPLFVFSQHLTIFSQINA